MSTTDQLKQQIAPATAAAQQQTAVVQAAKQPTTLLGVVRSPSFQKQMALAVHLATATCCPSETARTSLVDQTHS